MHETVGHSFKAMLLRILLHNSIKAHISYVTSKSVFGVCDQFRLKPPGQLMRLDRVYSKKRYCSIQAANNEGADQTALAGLSLCCSHMA